MWSALPPGSRHRPVQARIDLLQLVGGLCLDAEMIQSRRAAARRYGEIDSRIVEHPLGVVVLHHGGLRREQRRVEADGAGDTLDGNVHVHALHGSLLAVFTH
jgi:hypothetical protein